MPSTEEPILFAENVNKATLLLPSETPGYRIVPDIKVLEVCTALSQDHISYHKFSLVCVQWDRPCIQVTLGAIPSILLIYREPVS